MRSTRNESFRRRVRWVGGMVLAAPALAWAAGPATDLPEPGGYLSYIRILLILAPVLVWLSFCQWVDKDTVYVKHVNRELWNGVVLGGGVVGLGVWLLLPWSTPGLFAAGFGLWFFVTAGACAVYVIVRNGIVDPAARVFTPRHIKEWVGKRGKGKDDGMASVEQVRLTAHDGAKITVPEDPGEMNPYEATQTLLFDALWRRATEVELLVGASRVKLAYRIDGVVTPRNDLLERDAAEVGLRFIKQAAGLDVDERRRPQQGSISGAVIGTDGGMTDIEVKSSGTTQHEKLGLKIVADESRLRIADLGMAQEQFERFEAVCKQPTGLVLVAGPKGSGLTTALYAALRSHDAYMQNLLSIEYEPLMELENITQHIYDPTQHEAGYARQFQTVLRREPDVVMVSDVQDRETAHLAAKAASEGKKVYAGIQAKDSFDGLKKLVSLAGDTDAVAQALIAATGQRLVRKLCIACRQAYKPDPRLLKKANLPADQIEHFFRPPPEGLVDQKGRPIICSNCQSSGYFGRAGAFELLEIDDAIRELIRQGQPLNAIKALCRKNRMRYLEEIALQKVIDGTTSMNEVLRVMRDENAVARAAKAKKKGG